MSIIADQQESSRTRRSTLCRVALSFLAMSAAVVLAVAAFRHVQSNHRAILGPTPPHAAAAQQCHDSGGVSMWRPFHREFVFCDYPDGRRVQAYFYFTKVGQ